MEKSGHIALTLPTASIGGIEETQNGNTNLPGTRKSLRRVSYENIYYILFNYCGISCVLHV